MSAKNGIAEVLASISGSSIPPIFLR